MRPVICLITPGRPPRADWERSLIDRVAAAARAGVHLIQIREPALEGRALQGLVERSLVAVRGTASRVLVNDRVDVALAAGAHGVHLRGDSAPAARVRALVPPGFLIGRSVHSPDEAVAVAEAGGLDYLIFGAVFKTVSKPTAAAAGVDLLAAACTATPLPVLAVGGVTPPRLAAVVRAGAAGFAAIGWFADCPLDTLSSAVEQACLAFDTLRTVP